MGRIPALKGGNGSPIQHLWEVHKEIARLDIAGVRPFEICSRLGYTASWLSTIMNSPVYRKYRDGLSVRKTDKAIDIQSQIHEGAEIGVSELLKALRGVDPEYSGKVTVQAKIKLAQDFLDRDGHGKVTKVERRDTVTFLDAERIQLLKDKRSLLLANLREPIQDAVMLETVDPKGTALLAQAKQSQDL